MTPSIAFGAFALAALAVAAQAALQAWGGWLELRRRRLGRGGGCRAPRARTELLDLKARVRRLETIASGLDG